MDGLGLWGDDSGWVPGQAALLHLVAAVLGGVRQLAGPRARHPAQTVSPVAPLIAFTPIWTEGAGVRQARVPQVSLLAAGFGCYRGLLLKPLGQLDEAVV